MREGDAAPFLSVVIPTRGRPILIETLASLLRTAWRDRLEIIVVGTIMDDEVRQQVQAAVEHRKPERYRTTPGWPPAAQQTHGCRSPAFYHRGPASVVVAGAVVCHREARRIRT